MSNPADFAETSAVRAANASAPSPPYRAQAAENDPGEIRVHPVYHCPLDSFISPPLCRRGSFAPENTVFGRRSWFSSGSSDDTP